MSAFNALRRVLGAASVVVASSVGGVVVGDGGVGGHHLHLLRLFVQGKLLGELYTDGRTEYPRQAGRRKVALLGHRKREAAAPLMKKLLL